MLQTNDFQFICLLRAERTKQLNSIPHWKIAVSCKVQYFIGTGFRVKFNDHWSSFYFFFLNSGPFLLVPLSHSSTYRLSIFFLFFSTKLNKNLQKKREIFFFFAHFGTEHGTKKSLKKKKAREKKCRCSSTAALIDRLLIKRK